MDSLINLLVVWFIVSIPASFIIAHLLARGTNPQPANRVKTLSLTVQHWLAQHSAPRLMPGKLAPNRLHLYF